MSASLYFQDIVVTDYNGGDLYFYQEFTGLNYVRMLTDKSITFSAEIDNVGGDDIAVYFGINRFYDPGNEFVRSRAINLAPGRNLVAAVIENIERPNVLSSGSCTMQMRMYLSEFEAPCHLRLKYIKAEFGKVATANIIDNFIEKSRIDNF